VSKPGDHRRLPDGPVVLDASLLIALLDGEDTPRTACISGLNLAIPGILGLMAKVMVSLPDELLGSLDAEAARRNTTRSGLLRDYVHEGLRNRGRERTRRIQQLMSEAGHHGGDVVGDLKRHRPTP